MPEGVGPAPDRAERAHARPVEHLERIEGGVDDLGPLEVGDGREHAGAQAGRHLVGRAHDAHLPGRLLLQAEEVRDQGERRAPGIPRVERRGRAHRVAAFDDVHVEMGVPDHHVVAVGDRTRRHEGGAEAAGETARAGARAVDVAHRAAREEVAPLPRRARGPIEAKQGVVMPIEDGYRRF